MKEQGMASSPYLTILDPESEKILKHFPLWLIGGLFYAMTLNGQTRTISGIVRDAKTKELLPYANVVLQGTIYGTISKDDGRFSIEIPEKTGNTDSLAISVIGYKTYIKQLTGIKDSVIIYLEPRSVHLQSVHVSPRTPEEMIALAVEQISTNYITAPFNATIYFKTVIKLNGKYIESTEALIKGYIMPVTGDNKDTTRLKLLAMKYFDEQELAMKSIVSKKRKKKEDKLAIEGMDTILIGMTKGLNEYFGIYTQIDSNLIKQLYLKGYRDEKSKLYYGPMVKNEDRNLIKIEFKGNVKGLAHQTGNLLLEENSLAFEAFNFKLESSSLKIKLLLMLAGIGFKSFDVVLGFRSIPTKQGWIPHSLTTNAFIDMEKNKWFSKDIPLVIELSSRLKFLDIEFPATDLCTGPEVIQKKSPLNEHFKSDPGNEAWKIYGNKIKSQP